SFATVELPPTVPRFVRAGAGPAPVRVVPVEQLVKAHIEAVFPGRLIEDCAAFRVPRQAEGVATHAAIDLLASAERQPRLERHAAAVPLEVERDVADHLLDRLM